MRATVYVTRSLPPPAEELLREQCNVIVHAEEGLGRIEQAMAKRAKGFDMRVLYSDLMRRTPDEEERTEAEYCSLNRLLRTSDFVTVRAPLTKKTHHMIDERRLRLMKSTALLINTSRGPLVNESALITALTERWIAGTGLDVFEMEPIRENNPLLRLNNVVLLPHIGGATHKARSKMAEIVAENVLAALHGRQPKGGLPHMTLGAVNNGLGSCWMGTTPPQDAHQADEAAG